ncbi:MAG: M20 family metallopeptidase, partial [Erysipelotrichaceae bacterium]|nr:M20 family metallopeptidase [Erysipelotrichaceae bacterium]
IRKKDGAKKSLMLFGHIDTETEDYFGEFDDPYKSEEKDGKIFGLGAADDKGGIVMMLEAVEAALSIDKDLDYDLTVLSILGKHSGAFGALSAMMNGYSGNCSLYIHPAETGHGFQEIKNISLGLLDMKLTVYGKPGIPHDDLSQGINANLVMVKAIRILEDYSNRKREECIFDLGSFKGQPSFILNIGSISSKGDYGTICEEAECKIRCRFFMPLKIYDVYSEIEKLLKEKLDGDWILEKGRTLAEPAMVSNEDPFVKYVERSISEVEGNREFIHQYHGGSDVRFPVLYGNSRCVGIGPYCELPLKNSGNKEWIDIDNYLKGIAILTTIMLNYGKEDL